MYLTFMRQSLPQMYLTFIENDVSKHPIWVTRQKIQGVYQDCLMLDLEYAIDKKVEQDL